MDSLSITVANVDAKEWVELLVKSIWKFTSVKHEIIIIDNGSLIHNLSWLRKQAKKGKIRLEEQGKNLGHGGAMDLGTKLAKYPFICHFDVDSHVMREGWDTDLFKLYRSDPKIRMIAKKGPDHKPLHPPFFFYERNFILDNKISFEHVHGISTDTAQKSYWDILALGYKVKRIQGGPREFLRVYPGAKGHELNLNGKPTFFHFWCGTRFNENNPFKKKEKLWSEGWSYTLEDYLRDKEDLFKKPLVQEILKFSG